MTNQLIKGDEVRHGNLLYLDAISQDIIASVSNEPLSEKLLLQLSDGRTPISPLSTQSVIESYKTSGELAFALRLISEKTCMGACRLSNISWQARHAQLFVGILNEDYLTREILIDALHTTLQFTYWEANLNRIYVHCLADNELIHEALAQVGFTNEGQLRQEAYRNGHYLDIHIYSILQREWSRV